MRTWLTGTKCRMGTILAGFEAHLVIALRAMKIACGRICMHRKKINISTVLAGQRVGIKEVDDGIWIVSFPFGPRLLPMS
jgi:hypothetical protein